MNKLLDPLPCDPSYGYCIVLSQYLVASKYDQTLPGSPPGWSQLHSARALMENTTLEVEQRTFGLDILPLLLASALALILGQDGSVMVI